MSCSPLVPYNPLIPHSPLILFTSQYPSVPNHTVLKYHAVSENHALDSEPDSPQYHKFPIIKYYHTIHCIFQSPTAKQYHSLPVPLKFNSNKYGRTANSLSNLQAQVPSQFLSVLSNVPSWRALRVRNSKAVSAWAEFARWSARATKDTSRGREAWPTKERFSSSHRAPRAMAASMCSSRGCREHKTYQTNATQTNYL